MGGSLGGLHTANNHDFAFDGFIYYKVDEQVMLGIKSGQQNGGIPISGSGYMRLPLGRIIMPFATGDVGMVVQEKGYFFWRGGGGLDWKNGNHSSILIFGGFEQLEEKVGWYSRVGLLLEF